METTAEHPNIVRARRKHNVLLMVYEQARAKLDASPEDATAQSTWEHAKTALRADLWAKSVAAQTEQAHADLLEAERRVALLRVRFDGLHAELVTALDDKYAACRLLCI
jgi:hypothetical protein